VLGLLGAQLATSNQVFDPPSVKCPAVKNWQMLPKGSHVLLWESGLMLNPNAHIQCAGTIAWLLKHQCLRRQNVLAGF
jgi:hypothetical protein